MKQKKQIIAATFLSVLIHATIVCAIVVFSYKSAETPFGEKEYIVAVDMISDTSYHNEGKSEIPDNVIEKSKIQNPKSQTNPKSKGPTMGAMTTGDGGTSKILAQIKAKIERAKRYPRLAKKMRIEGRPTVLFEINSNGSIKYVKVISSSGEHVIDEAALATVKRAAPLPYYSKPIRLAIRYELK